MKSYEWQKIVPYWGCFHGEVKASTLEEAKELVVQASSSKHLEGEWVVGHDYGATIQHVLEGWTGFFCFVSLLLYEKVEKR